MYRNILRCSNVFANEFGFHDLHLLKFPQLQTSHDVYQTRKFKSEINIEWCPPPRISCTDPSKSGDRSPLPHVDSNRPQYRLQNIATIEEISPIVKQLASLEFAPKNKHVQVIKHDFLKEIQRHQLDHASMESTISCLTVNIRSLQNHFAQHKTDKIAKVQLKEKIEQRNAFLKHLRRMDYKRYEWLLEKLDLVHYTQPNPILPITRKDSLRKLTTIYCNNIKRDRIDNYKKELEEQKLQFVEEKKQVESWIEKEEKELAQLMAKK